MSLVVAGGAVLLSSALVAAELSLEPCINGGVSASGLYASQTEEDLAKDVIADATAD
jgi:hypothetical protein